MNHPNIAAIYGIEEGPAVEGPAQGGHHVRARVMELVEGEDLSPTPRVRDDDVPTGYRGYAVQTRAIKGTSSEKAL